MWLAWPGTRGRTRAVEMPLAGFGVRRDFLPHLLALLLASASALMIDRDPRELTCSQGLSECRVSAASPYYAALPDPEDVLDVTRVNLTAVLCCAVATGCEVCLRIGITVQEVDNTKEEASGIDDDESLSQMSEGSGQFVPPEPRAPVKVCLSSPFSNEFCKTLEFKRNYSGHPPTYELLLTEKARPGSPVVVHAHSRRRHNIQHITIPSLEEVCSMDLEMTVKGCDAPRLRAVNDHQRNVVLLQLENADDRENQLMCRMIWNETPGDVLAWPKGKREIAISSNLIAPCLCFQVWWKGEALRRKSCPFENQQDVLERMKHNVSVSVVESRTMERGTWLSWNVTAPCRLEAELWLCKKRASGGWCEEVTDSRQRLHGHTQAGWTGSHSGHWKTGEFNVSSHPLLCVQIKIHGMQSCLEPHCPFETTRWRWTLPLLIGFLLICLAILGAHFIQWVQRGHVCRWQTEDDVKGAVCGGHVVLLYLPDDDLDLPALMCHLGSLLQALGFSVSLDLWNQAELSMLGPVPWLHSRLDRLQRQGGKVVLVLTKAAWIRAEEWGAQSWERDTMTTENRDMEEDRRGNCTSPSACSNVFSASLSCVLADYLLGRAGERFMLVQLESLPPEPPGGCLLLPELFHGLHVYSLPSQSLGFLTELAGAQQMATASAQRKRAAGIRIASRSLARGLSEFTSGTTALRVAGISRGCDVEGMKDSGETVPLRSCLITPPSSPETGSKGNEMDWV